MIRFKHGECKRLPTRRSAHQKSDSTVANEHTRTDHQPSQKFSSARNPPSPSSFNREGANTIENFPQQVTGRENFVFILVHRKCTWRSSFISKVDQNSLNRHNDNTNHNTGESLRSATVAIIIRTLHQIHEDCILPTGHFLWALAASDGLPVKQTQTSWCVCLS